MFCFIGLWEEGVVRRADGAELECIETIALSMIGCNVVD